MTTNGYGFHTSPYPHHNSSPVIMSLCFEGPFLRRQFDGLVIYTGSDTLAVYQRIFKLARISLFGVRKENIEDGSQLHVGDVEERMSKAQGFIGGVSALSVHLPPYQPVLKSSYPSVISEQYGGLAFSTTTEHYTTINVPIACLQAPNLRNLRRT
ncbi:hypothetical protein BDQ17DRAFT_1357556, partial [Cyathus striatus]